MQKRLFSRTCRSVAMLGAAAGILMVNVGFLGVAYAGKPVKPPTFIPVLIYQQGGDLIAADASGQNKAVVRKLNGSGTAAWSPDGAEIVFVDRTVEDSGACEAGSVGLFLLNIVNAQGTLDLTDTPICIIELNQDLIEFNSPTWSDVGIAYSDRVLQGNGNSEQWDLFLIGPEVGAQPVNLTRTTNQDEIEPSWSPDGGRLVFVRYPSADSFASNGDLEVGTVDLTSDPPLIGTSILPGTGLETADFVDTPDWSNHSDQIAVVAELPGQHKSDTWVIELGPNNNGIDAWNLTEDLSSEGGLPSWSGNDSEIVVLTDAENTCNFKPKDRNGWLLAKIDADVPSTGCVDAFIGPPGTNTRQNFPRSLDWLPTQ